MYRMTSSLRFRSLRETLDEAQRVAAIWGVTRVVDTTWLDDIGIPVFASIRPDAHPRSLCVHNGKGSQALEAHVGALMEAIEFRAAEDRERKIERRVTTAGNLVAEWSTLVNSFDWLDLCPLLGRVVTADTRVQVSSFRELRNNDVAWLPTDLLVHPNDPLEGSECPFGTSTNGLSSGNTVSESLIHGICEVLERDVRSFNFLEDRSYLVEARSAGQPTILQLIDSVESAGYQLVVRETPNQYDLPYYDAYVIEKNLHSPIAISLGSGLHPIRDIALVRAISEAVQSRLTHIHGGRDDIIDRHKYYSIQREGLEYQDVAKMAKTLSSGKVRDLSTANIDILDIDDALKLLYSRVQEAELSGIYWASLPCPSRQLAVTRVVIPGAEYYKGTFERVGKRLRKAAMQRLAA